MEKNGRINSLDTLRGLSVIFYLMFHFSSWWSPGSTEWLFGGIGAGAATLFYIPYFGIIAAPVFIMVSGMSMTIAIENRRQRNVPESDIRTHVLKRGLILFIIATFLHLVYFHLFPGRYFWIWEEIQTIAISGIMIYFISKIPIKWRAVIIFLMLFSYPYLRIFFKMEQDYATFNYNPPWSIDRFIAGMISNGFCPLIPQSTIALVGSIYAGFITSKEKMREITPILLICSGSIIMVTLFLQGIPALSWWTDGMTWMQTFGIWSLALIGLYWLQDIKKGPVFDPLTIFSSLSLSLFYIHIIFGFAIFYLVGGVHMLSPSSFYFLFLFFCIAVFIFGYFWRKIKWKGSLEWLLRSLT